jgi:N-acetylglucosaminyldiphosphoundecaprenol N-acetyl-beta-D-mannosaminyltransferase
MKEEYAARLDASRGRTRPHIEILGCRVSRITLGEAIELIETWIETPCDTPRHIVATGFHGIWEAYKNPTLRQVLNSADLFCPDGIAPVWLSRLRGESLSGRVSGPDLLAAFLAKTNSVRYSSFFFGDTDETLAAVKRKIQSDYPRHRVAGVLSPPFRDLTADEDRRLVDRINDARPDVLWVGLGMPKQEWWIHEHRNQLRVPVVAGVGAAFRFLGGLVRRAPQWIGNCGFEWLWRLAMEPGKLWRRDLVDGPQFLARALFECMHSKRNFSVD